MSSLSKDPLRPLKRARPVHSCLPCRNKKLRCDRKTPCEMCIKSERPDQCHYDAKAGSMSKADEDEFETRPAQARRLNGVDDQVEGHTPGPRESRVGIVEDLQSRVDKLEALLSAPENIATLGLFSGPREPDPQWIPGRVEWKEGRSVFRPLCHKSAILYRFSEAKVFISNKVSNPSIVKALRALRARFPKQSHLLRADPKNDSGKTTLSRLYELLPTKRESDLLVNSFLEQGQSVHCILDRQKFLEEYDRYWGLTTPKHAESSFTALLVLIVSIASLLEARTPSASLNLVCDLVADWLHESVGKTQTDLMTLQIEALLVYSMQCSGVITEQVYRTSGRLVRSAFISGLQYDPGNLSQIPPEEVNTRRTLWTAIAELDLQASLTCGLPCALDPSDFTCRSPAPSGRGELGHVLSETLAMRLEGGRIMRLKPGERGRAMQCIKAMEKAQASEIPGSSPLSKAFFDTLCHRSLVSFVRPLLEGPTLAFGRLCGCMSSLVVLEHLEKLKSKPQEFNFYFRICNQDIFQACLVASLMLRVRNIEYSITPPATSGHQYTMMAQPAEISDKVRRALRTLLTHISSDLVGGFVKDLIVLSVVLESAENPMSSGAQQLAMDQGFHLVIDTLNERDRPDGSPAESGHSSSGFTDTSAMNFENPAWMSAPMFNFDFGLPLDQNFGMEYGTFNPESELQWAAP